MPPTKLHFKLFRRRTSPRRLLCARTDMSVMNFLSPSPDASEISCSCLILHPQIEQRPRATVDRYFYMHRAHTTHSPHHFYYGYHAVSGAHRTRRRSLRTAQHKWIFFTFMLDFMNVRLHSLFDQRPWYTVFNTSGTMSVKKTNVLPNVCKWTSKVRVVCKTTWTIHWCVKRVKFLSDLKNIDRFYVNFCTKVSSKNYIFLKEYFNGDIPNVFGSKQR